MSIFKLKSQYQPAGDQPEAIKKLSKVLMWLKIRQFLTLNPIPHNTTMLKTRKSLIGFINWII